MKTIEEILTDNNFELNDNNEAVFTMDLENSDEAYEKLDYIREKSAIDVFLNVMEDESDNNTKWVVADFFFDIENQSPDVVEHTVNIILNA